MMLPDVEQEFELISSCPLRKITFTMSKDIYVLHHIFCLPVAQVLIPRSVLEQNLDSLSGQLLA